MTNQTPDLVTYELSGGIATLTLNRPATHNALNATLIAELKRAADWLTGQSSLRAVVLTGADASFCARGDLGRMQQNMKKSRAERVAESFELALMLPRSSSWWRTWTESSFWKVQGLRPHGNRLGASIDNGRSGRRSLPDEVTKPMAPSC